MSLHPHCPRSVGRSGASPGRVSRLAATLSWLVALALSGCAHLSVDAAADPQVRQLLASADIVLLGEVHDNPEHHALRLRWLREAAQTRRFVLVMEQFDVDRQPQMDDAVARGLSAADLAHQAGFSFQGWHWPSYEPFVALALSERLPLRAGNLPARAAMAAARAQPPVAKPAGWGEAEDRALARLLDIGHCGMLPAAALGPMAAAQRARDARMAQVLAQARRDTGLPVVLLAGNGHVRKDLGVPRWLATLRPSDRIATVGLEESPGDSPQDERAQVDWAARYDRVLATAPAAREDPCEMFRKRKDGAARSGQ